MSGPSRDEAVERDRDDPLAALRDRVVRHDPELIYLDGNSLGMLPVAARSRLVDVVDQEWGAELIRGWHHWFDLPTAVGDRLGATLLGAAPGQVLVCDTITVNLYKLAHAVLAREPRRRVIVTDRRNFPSDRYVLEGVAQQFGGEVRYLDTDPIDGADPDAVEVLLDDDVALVELSHVDYRSGVLADLSAITRRAHRHGALVLWDLAHSVGAVEVDLDAHDVDLAVGCTYKYLNSGPGAPGFLYVKHRLVEQLETPIRGWWGQQDPFDMDHAYQPAPSIRRFLSGSQSVLGLVAVEEGVASLAEAGLPALRQKSMAITDYLVQLVDAWLVPLGFQLRSPRDASRRGGHIVVGHPDAQRIAVAMVREALVIPDMRPPDLIRLAPAPLTTSFVDVFDGLARMRDLVAERRHESIDVSTLRVT
jgi:kynureninase